MKPTTLVAFLFASIWMCPDTAYALFETKATFGSFYGGEWTDVIFSVEMGMLVISVVGFAVTLLTGDVTTGTNATATLIGNFIGLTGTAATKAGFLLVGGSFVVNDVWAVGSSVLHERRETKEFYARLVGHSEELITFPLPKSNSGSSALKESMSILESADDTLPLSGGDNRWLLKKAVSKLRWSSDVQQDALAALVHIDKGDPRSSVTNLESAKEAMDILLESSDVTDLRDATLLSLLYFVLNDYKKADHYAGRAREIAQEEDPEGYLARVTIPTFITATCALYDQEVDYAVAMDQFKEAILAEPKNKLIPLLFSIFLDRFTLRSMSDGHFDPRVFSEAFDIMKTPSLEKFRLTNYIILLGRYLMHIENEELKIRSLAGASDPTIRKHPEVLPYVNDALDAYRLLLRGASDVESNIVVLSLDKLDEAQREAVAELRGKYTLAILEKEELASLVKDLERQQGDG